MEDGIFSPRLERRMTQGIEIAKKSDRKTVHQFQTRISLVEEDDQRLKRLHLFLTKDNIERATMMLNNVKRQGTQKEKMKADSNDSSSMDADSQFLDDITEESEFDQDEFQDVIREKIKHVKAILSEIITNYNENARVMYGVQHYMQHSLVTQNAFARIFRELRGRTSEKEIIDGEVKFDVESSKFCKLFVELVELQQVHKQDIASCGDDREKIREEAQVLKQEAIQETQSLVESTKSMFLERLEAKEDESDSLINMLKGKTQEALDKMEIETKRLEDSIRTRVEDCETLVRSRITEAYVKDLGKKIQCNIIDAFNRKNASTIEEIRANCDVIALKQAQLETRTEGTLNGFRNEMDLYKKEIEQKASKKLVQKMNEGQIETRVFFEAQFDQAKGEIKSAQQKVETLGKLVINLENEMKERDDALRKVPANVSGILKELRKKMEAGQLYTQEVASKFNSKLSIDDFETAIETKLDKSYFQKIFPRNRAPLDHLKNMIKIETEQISQRVLDMVKLWDQKIVALRHELNLQGLHKKMALFANESEVGQKFDVYKGEISILEKNLGKVQAQVQGNSTNFDSIQAQINDIWQRQQEVVIGKRNVNCLSCNEEPEDKQIKGQDGRIYRGKSLSKHQTQDSVSVQKGLRPQSPGSQGSLAKVNMLQMTWDKIGIDKSFSRGDASKMVFQQSRHSSPNFEDPTVEPSVQSGRKNVRTQRMTARLLRANHSGVGISKGYESNYQEEKKMYPGKPLTQNFQRLLSEHSRRSAEILDINTHENELNNAKTDLLGLEFQKETIGMEYINETQDFKEFPGKLDKREMSLGDRKNTASSQGFKLVDGTDSTLVMTINGVESGAGGFQIADGTPSDKHSKHVHVKARNLQNQSMPQQLPYIYESSAEMNDLKQMSLIGKRIKRGAKGSKGRRRRISSAVHGSGGAGGNQANHSTLTKQKEKIIDHLDFASL